MTEEEWLACDDSARLYLFARDATTTWRTRWVGWVTGRRFDVSERKLRLAACACCSRIAHLLPAREAYDCLKTAERFAEGQASEEELRRSERQSMAACAETARWYHELLQSLPSDQFYAVQALSRVHRTDPEGRVGMFQHVPMALAQAELRQQAARGPLDDAARNALLERIQREEMARDAELVRDVLGNPFRPVVIDPGWLAWGDGTALRIAREIDATRGYQDLPVLADALEEAGCSDESLLSHCRAGGLHAPGCWVVDLLLGKT